MSSAVSSIRSTGSSATITSATQNAGAQCYAFENYAAEVFQSIGNDLPVLCASDGALTSAMLLFQNCLSENTPATAADYCGLASEIDVTILATAVNKCSAVGSANGGAFDVFNSYTTRCFQQSAEGIASAQSSLCSAASSKGVSLSGCGETLATTTSTGSNSISQASRSSSTAALSSPTAAISSPTATPSVESSHLSTGAIAGIAVGAVLGGIILISGVGWFVYRRRKQNKARTTAVATSHDTAEKAQLHSDDKKPDRKELEGFIPRKASRRVGGLNELPADHIEKTPAEMTVNETVGSELEGTSDASTKVESTRGWEGSRSGGI